MTSDELVITRQDIKSAIDYWFNNPSPEAFDAQPVNKRIDDVSEWLWETLEEIKESNQ